MKVGAGVVLKTSSFGLAGAKNWARELFNKHTRTGAVIASNDIMAAVLKEALQTGKRVPEDIQIIGFDDIPQSSQTIAVGNEK
ncbi:MAG: substrate-binding domain-containing protein [Bacillus sp. (in: firmicutes)]